MTMRGQDCRSSCSYLCKSLKAGGGSNGDEHQLNSKSHPLPRPVVDSFGAGQEMDSAAGLSRRGQGLHSRRTLLYLVEAKEFQLRWKRFCGMRRQTTTPPNMIV
mmetsp:Transcript_40470/g.127448  ORF Transcript_40470/g.127448 Transcript_40470/m.127448 type:complete len:104 (+) Transcript_40470:950-1261(+)